MCDTVNVLYAGRVIESAPASELIRKPLHAYTRGLLSSIPRLETPHKSVLPTIPGMVASLSEFVPGCRFCQRMERSGPTLRERPEFIEARPGHWVEACPICYHAEDAVVASGGETEPESQPEAP